MTIGHNTAMMCSNIATAAEIPDGFLIGSRLDREWKVTKTNIIEEFNLDLTLNQCDPLDEIDITKLRLLVDEDGDFSDAEVHEPGGSLSFAYADGVLSVLGISETQIANNSTAYITIAYELPELGLTGPENICIGESATLTFGIIGAISPLDIFLSDGLTTIEISDVENGDTYIVTPVDTTEFQIWIANSPLNCCVEPASVPSSHTINVVELPVVDLGLDDTICLGSSFIIDALNPGSEYLWNNGEITQTIEVTEADEYSVTVTDIYGCIGEDAIEIWVETPPDAGEDNEASICNTDDLFMVNTLLSPGILEGGNWTETSPVLSGSFDSDLSELTVLGLAEGIYTFEYELEGVYCPNDIAIFTVEIVEPPFPGVPASTAICNDIEINLNDLIDPDVDPGNWQEITVPISGAFNAMTGVFDGDLLEGRDYLFEYTADAIGPCPAETNTITVPVNENPIITFHSTLNEGCTPVSVSLINDTDFDGASDCLWELSNGTTGIDCERLNLYLTEVGCYAASLTMTENGCTSTTTVTDIICVRPLPVASFFYNPTTIYSDNPLVEFTNISDDYIYSNWNFGDESISDENNPEHMYAQGLAGEFEVQLIVTNEFGCIDSTTRLITINDEPLFYIPNTFTPDGDSKNNVFKPIMTSGFDVYDYHLTVYNRWGEIVFESYDALYGWNGTYGGSLVDGDVYVWKLEFGDQTTDRRHYHEGHILLLK